MQIRISDDYSATRFAIIDRQTRQQIGKPYKCRKHACRRRDKLDNEYGGCKYIVVELMADGSKRSMP